MDIIAKFNLPKYLKGKSFSEASAMIAKRFKGRTSPEDIQTLNELQGRLQQAQEYVKAEQKKRTMPQQEMGQNPNPEMSMGNNPNSYNNGGGLLSKLFGGGAGAAGGAAGGAAKGPGVGGYMQAATGALDLAKTAFGKPQIDTSGAAPPPDVPSEGASAASGAMKGAQAGMSFGPWGAGIGAVVGGVAGLVGGKKAKEAAKEAGFNHGAKMHNDATNSYRSGGKMLANMYNNGGMIDPTEKELAAKRAQAIQAVRDNNPGMENAELGAPAFNLGKYGVDGAEYYKQDIDGNNVTLTPTGSNPHSRVNREMHLKNLKRSNPNYNVSFNDGGSLTEPTEAELEAKRAQAIQAVRDNNPGMENAELSKPGFNLGKYGVQGTEYYKQDVNGDDVRLTPTGNNPHSTVNRRMHLDNLKRSNPGYNISFRNGGNVYNNGGDMTYNPNDPMWLKKGIDSLVSNNNQSNEGVKNAIDYDAIDSAFNKGIDTLDQDASVSGARRIENDPGYVMGDANLDGYNDAEQAKFGDKPEGSQNMGQDSEGSSRGRANIAEYLRYAPAAMNFAQLMSLKKPDTIGADRLNNQYNEQYVDERALQNTVQNSVNNMRNAILSSSGGDSSAARANLLASQLQGSKALSEAYKQADAQNRQENRYGQQFGLNVDQANLQQANRAQELNLEQDAAYKTNKSRLLAQIGQDLGGVGREELFKRYPELMGLNYDWKGLHGSKKKKSKKKSSNS